MEETDAQKGKRKDFAALLDRMENTYLALLRGGALVVATLLLIYAAWLTVSGIYKSSRDAGSVKEAVATVSAEDVTKVDLEAAKKEQAAKADPMKAEREFYQNFGRRYLALYRNHFEKYRQPDDPKASDDDFLSRFVMLDGRMKALSEGNINFTTDKADLEELLKVMTAAADLKVTKDRLQAYRNAKKVVVTRQVSDTRTERYCSYWGEYINSCIVWDTRVVPFTRSVTETRLPDGVTSPSELFAVYHEKFISTLGERREANMKAAKKAREEILADNANGAERFSTATKVVGSFVVLMFLFLLIALERHQRRLARSEPAKSAD